VVKSLHSGAASTVQNHVVLDGQAPSSGQRGEIADEMAKAGKVFSRRIWGILPDSLRRP